MFGLFKRSRSLESTGVFADFTDWHSHILPGVDDGIKTMDRSLSALSFYENLGVKKVWLTPHIMEDMPNTTDSLRARFSELKEAYNGPIVLQLAAENMIDNLFDERLRNNDLLPIGENGNHLLVETSYFTPPMALYEKLELIKSKGYFPVLAHPERYMYMSNDDYERLQNMGVKFQLNLLSLIKVYGKEVQAKARFLAKKGYYNITGTDIHSLRAFSAQVARKAFNGSIPQLKGL
jgi:tyrosine-protein phosphatase YwqE